MAVLGHRRIKPAGEPTGEELYRTHCVKCHAENPESVWPRITHSYVPLLEDHIRMAAMGPEYLTLIIRDGGTSVGRSKVMPRWREVFTEEEIERIVTYLCGSEEGDAEVSGESGGRE